MITYIRELTAAYAICRADEAPDRADLFTLVGTFCIGALVGLSFLGEWGAM